MIDAKTIPLDPDALELAAVRLRGVPPRAFAALLAVWIAKRNGWGVKAATVASITGMSERSAARALRELHRPESLPPVANMPPVA